MTSPVSRSRPVEWLRPVLLGIAGSAVLASTAGVASAQQPAGAATPAAADSSKPIPPEQLQSLVAPIALYPDDLLAQTLVASTYPLEIIQLQQWLAKHPGLKDKELADSVAKQPWDPSIQSMAAVPDVVKRLADDVQWTTDLGNAFLAQQADVMAAVQVMRKKAKDKGALESNEQQKVSTQTVEQQQVIVVQSANPEVVYVPVYSPAVVYPPPVYPYPPIYYPPYPPGAAMVSFTVGVMWGAAIWGGACCHAGWGGNNIYINNNNNFNQINHNVNRGGGANGNWQHNPQHRGGAPYADQRTANKYGGGDRGAGVSNRQAGAGQGQRGAGVSDRAAGAGQPNRGAGVSDRAGAGQMDRGAGVSDRAAGGAGGDRVGSRDIPSDRGGSRSGGSGGYGGGSSGFGGGSGGFDGASARASSSRGASSMGSRGGGGMSRGGGGGGRRR